MNEQQIFTLGQAARACGKSKGTISNAIHSGRLSAMSKEGGRYQIAASELFRVFPSNGKANVQHERHEPPQNTSLNSGFNADVEAKLRVSEAENRMLRERLDDLTADRDEWRETAKRAQLALLDQRPKEEAVATPSPEQAEKSPQKPAEGRLTLWQWLGLAKR